MILWHRVRDDLELTDYYGIDGMLGLLGGLKENFDFYTFEWKNGDLFRILSF